MKIERVDFFYLRMPEVLDIGDGSQDALLVRVQAAGLEGWGECEASPLTSLAAYICPMSHSACKPVRYAVEGMELNSAADIYKIKQKVHEHCFDLLQADHTYSGIDIALWDLLGKAQQEPVYHLLGYKKTYPKMPYASQLFGITPQETYLKAKESRSQGYAAVKFGWGPIGKGTVAQDVAQFQAAREGLGKDAYLMVDIGTYWGENVQEAQKRLQALKDLQVYWLEEPFANLALTPYRALADSLPKVALAAGEGCNNYVQAEAMISYGGLQFIQIDTGRIGGISAAKRVCDLAQTKGIKYVNHTFTSHLALSASLQPFIGIEHDFICEYPVEPKDLATSITKNKIERDQEGLIHLTESHGLGVEIDTKRLAKYLVDVEIKIEGKAFYHSSSF